MIIWRFTVKPLTVVGSKSFMRTGTALSCTYAIRRLSRHLKRRIRTTSMKPAVMRKTTTEVEMPAKKTMNFLKRLLTVLAAGIIAVALAACGKNSNSPPPTNAEGSPAQTKAEPTPQSAFERDLQDVRNSQFAHVWVFSRKDGKVLDKADAAYLRTNAPQVVDWVSTDG